VLFNLGLPLLVRYSTSRVFTTNSSTDKGPICIFLHLTITRDRTNRSITLTLPNKIKNIIQDNQLSKDDLKYISTPTKIPASPHHCLTKDISPKPGEEHIMKNIPYKSILGQALYTWVVEKFANFHFFHFIQYFVFPPPAFKRS
jgi:hypothetical protein